MIKYKDVFVIDDDKIYHFILKSLLSKNHVAIKSSFFENGQDALDILKEKMENNCLPDLILLDINMPVMDGWQFLEEFKSLKEQYKLDTTIYMITSSNDVYDLNRAKKYENEISNYFLKPINATDIFEIFSR